MNKVLFVDDRVRMEEIVQTYRKGTKMTIKETDSGIRIEISDYNGLDRAMADRKDITIPYEFVYKLTETLTKYLEELKKQ